MIEGHHHLSELIQPARLRRLTEMHHRVLGVVIALMKQETKRYPDEVLIRLILEHPDDLDLQQQVQQAFRHLTVQTAITT